MPRQLLAVAGGALARSFRSLELADESVQLTLNVDVELAELDLRLLADGVVEQWFVPGQENPHLDTHVQLTEGFQPPETI